MGLPDRRDPSASSAAPCADGHIIEDHVSDGRVGAADPVPSAAVAGIDVARLRGVLAALPDPIALVDEHCRIQWASDAVADLAGRPVDELVGTLAFDLFSKQENRALHEAYFAEVLATPGRHGPVEVTVTRADGEFRELQLTLTNGMDDPELRGVVVAIRDITVDPDAIEELRRREAWADALIRRGSELILVTDRHGVITFANNAANDVLGRAPEDLMGRSWFELLSPDDPLHGDPNAGDRMLAHPRDHGIPLKVLHADGSTRHLTVYLSDLMGDPRVAGIVVNAVDVTDRLVAEHLLAEQASLLEAMARGLPLHETFKWITAMIEDRIPNAAPTIGVIDDGGWIRYPVLPSWGSSLIVALDQMRPDTELGRQFRSVGRDPLFVTDLTGRWWDPLKELIAEHDVQACWTWPTFSHQTGELIGALVIVHREQRKPTPEEVALLDRSMNLAAIAIDRHRLQTALEHRAQHDALTGLPNRTALIDRIEQALSRARSSGYSVAVLFVDLDRFKLINDSLGHAVGDVLLEQVAARFRAALRPGDVVGRFGGDEFVVVCENITGETVAVAVADRLREALEEPFEVAGRRLVVTASIGIARTSGDDTHADALIRDADVAMYRAKGRGRDTSVVFQVGDQEKVARVLELEHDLRVAIDEDQLSVHCQPLVQVATGRLVGFEALVRWDRPGIGRVMPSELIPIAEESGLILGLGRRVLERACSLAAAWPVGADGVPPWVSVNVSPRQLADPRFPGQVAEALERSGLSPSRLCLELTETAIVGDDAVAVSTLVGLKALGVRIAIDDFGTGHASLDYVRRFAVADMLKIDRSFVAGLEEPSGHDRAIVAAVVALGAALGFSVAAEGVETEGQRRVLEELGCELAQGYWFGRPAPPEALDEVTAAGALPLGVGPER
jgi:diguanylate cyclase (GGDEF)-like protein/PAS domain S-box-containing protein